MHDCVARDMLVQGCYMRLHDFAKYLANSLVGMLLICIRIVVANDQQLRTTRLPGLI